MKIKKLQLKNGYKRFFDLTIDLGESPKKIIALLGPNGCGKSSILDGILYRVNAHSLVGNQSQKDYRYHSMNSNPQYNYTNINIIFDIGEFTTVYNQKQQENKHTTLVSFRSPYRYNSQLRVTETRAISDIRTNNYGATTTSDIDAKMEDSYRRLYVMYNKYLNDADCSPSVAKQKIIGDLNQSINNCLNIRISSIGNIEAMQGTLFFKKPDHPNEFDFNVLSSGEKEVVDILLDLYLRSNDFSDTVFLFDEPDLHINTSIQRKLLIEMDRLIDDNCQIWIATHSIGFMRALQDDLKDKCQVIHFTDEMNLASAVYTITPEKMSRKEWSDIFSIALDDLIHLVAPKRIIYCEGKDRPGRNSQEEGLDAKVFNNVFNEKYYDSLFLSSGGNTELDQRSQIAITLLSKVFPDIEILVLKDRDISSGKFTTQPERTTYLQNNPPNHRVLKRWEIENYLFDKEVLKKYCANQDLVFSEEEYDRFVTNIDDQNLKDESNRIRNFCNITTSINPEIFKLKLSNFITEEMSVYKELESCIFESRH